MNNADLRKKALSKVKIKNLTFQVVLSYLLVAASMLTADLTGNALLNLLLLFAAAFAASLFGFSGRIRVSVSGWRQGKAEYRDFFCRTAPVRDFCGAIPYAVLLVLFRYFVIGAETIYEGMLVFALLLVLYMFACYGAYSLVLQPAKSIGEAYREGLAMAARNLGRIAGHMAVLHWWTFAVCGGIFWACKAGKMNDMAIASVLFFCVLMLRWAIGSFNNLAEAGLARKLFEE